MVYNLSPYAYCAGNPMKYIDKDGKKTRIYISKNLPGHAFLTTGEGSNTIVYTYGRYGALNESSGQTSGGAPPRWRGSLWQVVKGSSLWSITVIPYIFDVDLSIQSFLSKDLTKIKDPQAFVEELLESFYKQ